MTAPDGLLLWVGGEEGDLSEDFLLLGVRDGVLQVYNKRDKRKGEVQQTDKKERSKQNYEKYHFQGLQD